jgi:hypothetical protein
VYGASAFRMDIADQQPEGILRHKFECAEAENKLEPSFFISWWYTERVLSMKEDLVVQAYRHTSSVDTSIGRRILE